MAQAEPLDGNDPHYQWNEFKVLDPAHLAYDLPDTVPSEMVDALVKLTLRDIGSMAAKDIRKLYTDMGLHAPVARQIAALRNGLLAARTTAETRAQAAIQALGVGTITTAERARLKLLEEKLAALEKRQAEGEDINMRPRKRPNLLTEPKGRRELEVGEASTDGTFALVEFNKDPKRVLFFDKGAYGFKAGAEPPSDRTVSKYLRHCKVLRSLGKTLSDATVSKIATFDWANVDIQDFAREDLENVRGDRNDFFCAVELMIAAIGVVHGESIGKRAKEFMILIKTKNTAAYTPALLEKYMLNCFKHFATDLQEVYDEWVERPDGASMDITLPKIGSSVHVEAVQNISEKLEKDRLAALEAKMMEVAKEMVLKAMGASGVGGGAPGDGRGSAGRPGGRRGARRIIASKVPADTKGVRLCVAFAESRCRDGSKCKFSHERMISEKELKNCWGE
jgi:hypothetical protein